MSPPNHPKKLPISLAAPLHSPFFAPVHPLHHSDHQAPQAVLMADLQSIYCVYDYLYGCNSVF